MHRITRDRMNWAYGALAAAVATAVTSYGVVSICRLRAAMNPDCSCRPATEVFSDVFGCPPPPGVSDLRAVGRIYFSGSDAYLRFRATDSAIRELTKRGAHHVAAQDVRDLVDNQGMAVRLQGDPELTRWRRILPWDEEVERLRKPEMSLLLPHAPSGTPSITVIVDRTRHLIYAYCYDI